MFDDVLLGLQAEDPKIHALRRMLHKLIRNILNRFVKPSAMIGKCVDNVNYKLSYNIKSNKDLVTGEDAKLFICNKDTNHMRQSRIEEFYRNIILYFNELCDYLMKKLPLNHEVLVAAEVVDVALQTSAKVSDLELFTDRYSCLIPENTTKDKLIEQFTDYQSFDIAVCIIDIIDATWVAIGQIEEDGCLLFRELAILTIPHSSAHCEKVFSCVRKKQN